MTEPLHIIYLPKPHKDLSPNSRVHWAISANLKKSLRFNSYLMFRALVRGKDELQGFKEATIKRVFYFKDNRRRDKDNFDAMTKAVSDGMVDSGLLLDDDQITWMPTEFIIDKEKDSHLEYHIYSLS